MWPGNVKRMTVTRRQKLFTFFSCYLITIWKLLCLLSFKLHEDLRFVNNLLNVKTIILLVFTKYIFNYTHPIFSLITFQVIIHRKCKCLNDISSCSQEFPMELSN